MNVEKAPSWDSAIYRPLSASVAPIVEGYQGKSEDRINHGLEINPDIALTLDDVIKEHMKVSNAAHKTFLKVDIVLPGY